MSLDTWQSVGIVCGALVAMIAVVGLAGKGLRGMWRLAGKANRWLDQVLGEPAHDGLPARPSLMQRVESIERRTAEYPSLTQRLETIERSVAEHLEWHTSAARGPWSAANPGPVGDGGSGAARPQPGAM